MNFKIVSIFIMVLSLIFLGCIERENWRNSGSDANTNADATPTPVPTVVPTTVQPTPIPTTARTQALYISDVDEFMDFTRSREQMVQALIIIIHLQ